MESEGIIGGRLISQDFGGLELLLSFYIRRVNIAVSRHLDKKLSGLDVAKGTGKIGTLLIVSRHPGISPSEVADIILRDRSSMGRLLVRMEAQGLILRNVSPHDQRSLALYLTPAGHRLAEKVIQLTRQQDDEFFYMVTASEKETMIHVCDKILNCYQSEVSI
ncbi:MarR family winged helix-turn-helix transcriptional regulator [Tatumella terrea]|uniref:MarR family winged helix-turn-helix transcriptional regulator n=1 Tax=Tatumella terrea TaxID=419007 RepID=UPI0031D8539E